MRKVAVIGSGSWGTAMTGLVAPSVDEVVQWALEPDIVESINTRHHNARYLVDYEMAPNVRATSSMEEAASGAEAVILASPSGFLRRVCHQLAPVLGTDVPVLVLSKGIELGTHYLMHQVAAEELGNPARVAALSGPNHAEEICLHKISAAVVAAEDMHASEYFQSLLVCPSFRVYVSDDICGIETCAAVKNVVAIACGIAVGLGAGDNTLAVLMTRGIAEIGRVVSTLGGNPMTCMGLAGMGDLVVTCTSEHSRNRTFGEAFAKGETLEQYEGRTRMVVEGARACQSVWELAQERDIEVPITKAVYGLLYEGLPLQDAVDNLLGRVPNKEFYGMSDER